MAKTNLEPIVNNGSTTMYLTGFNQKMVLNELIIE